jgi:IS30 family transposase
MAKAKLRPSAKAIIGRYLAFPEREDIAIELAKGSGIRAIACKLGRSPSTISREVRRNAATRSGSFDYRASAAQWHSDRAARRPKPSKLATHTALHTYVEERLAGKITSVGGIELSGPDVAWKGRRAVHRQSRRWSTAWSPEQISHRLRLDYPEDPTMRISHEAIYQSLYIQGRGALRRELTACLRSGRALRLPRERARCRGKSFIANAIMISERPPEIADRAVPGHWEGDLILGLGSSAIGTMVERSTRFTMLLHLPRAEGYQRGQGVKNGSPLAGRGAEAVREAIARSMKALPEQLRQSLTWDQGAEMAQHVRLQLDTGLQIYFCDPQSPWQRGTPRTPMACFDSTSRKAQTSADTRVMSLMASLTRSTQDHARPLVGKLQLKLSTGSSAMGITTMLRRPLESALTTAIRMMDTASRRPSVGQGRMQCGQDQWSIDAP